jgi:hypothetical protein
MIFISKLRANSIETASSCILFEVNRIELENEVQHMKEIKPRPEKWDSTDYQQMELISVKKQSICHLPWLDSPIQPLVSSIFIAPHVFFLTVIRKSERLKISYTAER